MGWLNKIFKGSSHKISEGQYHGKIGDDRVWDEPKDALLEYEDIDRAIAISLSEEDKKGKTVIDNVSHLEEDEQLARALQDSLNMECEPPPPPPPPPDYEHSNIYPPMPFLFPPAIRICAGCNTEIGHGRFLSCMDAVWHPDCFRCHACGHPISDHEFSVSGNHPYHKFCYKERYHPKCDVCRNYGKSFLEPKELPLP